MRKQNKVPNIGIKVYPAKELNRYELKDRRLDSFVPYLVRRFSLAGMIVGRFQHLSITYIKNLSKIFRVNLGTYSDRIFFGVVDNIHRTDSVQINRAREDNILLLTEEEYLHILLKKEDQ